MTKENRPDESISPGGQKNIVIEKRLFQMFFKRIVILVHAEQSLAGGVSWQLADRAFFDVLAEPEQAFTHKGMMTIDAKVLERLSQAVQLNYRCTVIKIRNIPWCFNHGRPPGRSTLLRRHIG